MGFFDKLRGEFIDIIEWTEPNHNETLAYRFPRYNNEIKYGAKLTVREGQAAVFVNEGQIADVFPPGMYTLETQNVPILSTLKGWKYGFSSPFKAEVYFVSTKQWTDQKWGTANPIMLRDAEFGPIRIRAFGTYAFRVSDPGAFLKQLVATDPSFESYEISQQLRNTIVSRFTDVVGQAKIPILELAGNYDRMSTLARERISPDLMSMGLALTLFYIENISLPPEVEAALDKRSQMSLLGNVDQYTRFQAADAMRDAAQNPGGAAGVGVGLGAGFAVGGQMAGAMANAVQPVPVGTPVSAPPAMPGSTVMPPTLPPQAPVQLFVAINGQQAGPFDWPTLQAYVQNGTITRQTLVWKVGMANWDAASNLPELATLFAHLPPPMPGA
ncbi:SPFH domain-containing protein [Tuwongella immobilis]|uniref:GYF domain-containing protein n=1 Tax=Tuwongella immobilis TaxID=692036 RepID=A0A6C2YSG0_9BACT|nr:SPFH domain-containing protein [Tuwongella immobilis]VIP03905.1 Putative virion core protein (Lumpy skin disease virus)-like protein OS=Candidatus Competibacter denitrificans Run_A_D11 GN=BN873_360024 PE=4 SV=1: Band_7_1: DUF4339 [Tuwongella immobilis]VTS05177.1 Putative virion core protein (Lumpy skin disease virus)-like protein OS=Candidatus Competibacter denitrificans Run_A_D11 GN=BN873_360024 PE=4 SV=1: Band_7_1: DUF4339 [Tuwongella immobilis]